MGSWFSNIHVRKNNTATEEMIEKCMQNLNDLLRFGSSLTVTPEKYWILQLCWFLMRILRARLDGMYGIHQDQRQNI